MMTFQEYQEKTKTTAMYHQSIDEFFKIYTPEFGKLNQIKTLLKLSYVGLGLGEAGEIQGKIKKIIRDSGGVISDEQKKAIRKELGDLTWYVSETCNVLEIDMGEMAEENLEKLASRKERGVLKGEGDDR